MTTEWDANAQMNEWENQSQPRSKERTVPDTPLTEEELVRLERLANEFPDTSLPTPSPLVRRLCAEVRRLNAELEVAQSEIARLAIAPSELSACRDAAVREAWDLARKSVYDLGPYDTSKNALLALERAGDTRLKSLGA